MAPTNNQLRHHHIIESKGPNSFWVHRFSENLYNMANPFSRVVFFYRNQQSAENYVQRIENSQELS